jgi:hypothetical protein
MPDGVRHVGTFLPLRWYQIGLRRIVARGGGLDDVLVPLLALTLFFAVVLALIRLAAATAARVGSPGAQGTGVSENVFSSVPESFEPST